MNRVYCGSCSGAHRFGKLFHVDDKMIKGPGLLTFARFFPDDVSALSEALTSPARDKADFTPRAAGSPDQSRERVAPESKSLPTRAGP